VSVLAAVHDAGGVEARVGPMSAGTYVIQAEKCGPVKIGKTTNIESRLKALQTGHPNELVVLAFGGTTETERRMHRELSEHRIRGEWFEYSMPVRHAIAQLNESYFTSDDWWRCHGDGECCCIDDPFEEMLTFESERP
jgi:hypothetical protein